MMPISQKKKIQTNLLQWFKKNGRDLPWRKTQDPYAIWISEIMLQQTQVETVIPYYQRFLKSFPTIRRLARANVSKVLKVWEGLGYYARARNLHQASQIILDRFQGKIPENHEELLSLPGIGRYTAGAILSIAYNKEAPILDGNVKRVLSRVFAISGDKPEPLWEISAALVPAGKACLFNQGLMDLGAIICTAADPDCAICPLRDACKAKAGGEPEMYPARKKRKEIPSIEGVTAVVRWNGKVLIHQRSFGGLLGGLWEFPNWRTKNGGNLRQFLKETLKKEMEEPIKIRKSMGEFRQTFSHFRLTLHAYACEASEMTGNGRWVIVEKLSRFPMSRLHRRIANRLQNSEADYVWSYEAVPLSIAPVRR